jgi:hypothetical protein
MDFLSFLTRPVRRELFSRGFWGSNQPPKNSPPALNILVIGIYLTDHPSQAARLVRDFNKSALHKVDQVWISLGRQDCLDPFLKKVTAYRFENPIPKFSLLNQVVKEVGVEKYDYILFSDDDVALSPDFLDNYIAWVHDLGFSIAQPARTRYSHRNHKFCTNKFFVKARETRFVEIWPVFSFDKKSAAVLLPFSEKSPMGWGFDYVWPVIAAKNNMRMGIVDATPVDHSYRGQSKTYKSHRAYQDMVDYLAEQENLSPKHAKVNLKIYR